MDLLQPKDMYKLTGFYMEITSRCNLRCLHCYNDSGELKNEISFDTFKKCVDTFEGKDETEITISGGEPLLHPQIWKFVEYLGEKNFKNSLLITNGTLITKEVAAKLAHSKIAVQVSINGVNREEHDAICGQGNFDKTMQGIQNLINAEHHRIVLRCMISSFNYKHIEEFIVQMIDKVHVITLGFLSEMGRGFENKDKIGVNSFEKYELLEKLKNNPKVVNNKEKISIPEACFNGGCPLIHPSENAIPINPRISSDGNVHLCQAFDDIRYVIGNVKENTIEEMIKSEKTKHLINFLNMGIHYIDECQSCVWKYQCGKGCIAMALSKGTVQNTDGNCDIRKYVYGKEFVERIQNKISY